MELRNNTSLPTLGRWTLIKSLGSGATSRVFLGVDYLTQEHAAVKIYKVKHTTAFEFMKIETQMLKNFSHPNILAYIESYDSIEFYDPESGKTDRVSAVVMEYAQKGELFDFLEESGYLLEETARMIFAQLISALSHLHAKNIAHRDIKLENLLLDESLNLKIADFGYSSEFTPKKFEIRPVGTSTYFSPEIHSKLPFTAEAADLFAAGIVLFAMVTGHMPFMKASQDDQLYGHFYTHNQAKFWSYHEKLMRKKGIKFEFSENFKDLIERMFDVSPRRRLSLSDIKAHPWMKSSSL